MSKTTKYEYTIGNRDYPDEAVEIIGVSDQWDSLYDIAEAAAETEYTCGDHDDSEWPMVFSIFKGGVKLADISVDISLVPIFVCQELTVN